MPFTKECWTEYSSHQNEIGIVASFGHMVPDGFIDSFAKGMYVMHPSLLPKYRGACPIQHAILQKESRTGVSVIQISKGKFDAGKILLQRAVSMTPYTRFSELQDTLSTLGGEMLADIFATD